MADTKLRAQKKGRKRADPVAGEHFLSPTDHDDTSIINGNQISRSAETDKQKAHSTLLFRIK